MYNFSICAIFKNESHILEEWLLHYIYHGIEHFYLVNDNSNDNFIDIINKYKPYITLFNNDIQTKNVGRQSLIYEKYFRSILNESNWFAILDLDEFLYSPIDVFIPNIIKKYDNFSQIIVIWLHFGSNEHLYQPQSVVEGFTKRSIIDESTMYYSYKSIFKGNSLLNFSIHSQNVIGESINLRYQENDIHELIINHYNIQSLDFYLKIKSTKGDADNWFEHCNLERNLDLFKKYDINDIYDDRLYNQNKFNLLTNIITKIKNNKINNDNDDVTMIITSCNRPKLLEITLKSFMKYNTYPIKDIFIIDDSGIIGCNDNIINKFKNSITIKNIYNIKNIGQIESIDKVYSYVTTKYIFHCEEDWEFLQSGFIEKSLHIFNENKNEKIFTVWLRPHYCTSGHPIIYDNNNKGYYKMKADFSYMHNEQIYTWCGFTLNPGLRKTKDCLLFHPYSVICDKFKKNDIEFIGEYNVNKKYADAGYYAVILDDPKGYVNHIGQNDHIQRICDT
jgi:hypothetical protein